MSQYHSVVCNDSDHGDNNKNSTEQILPPSYSSNCDDGSMVMNHVISNDRCINDRCINDRYINSGSVNHVTTSDANHALLPSYSSIYGNNVVINVGEGEGEGEGEDDTSAQYLVYTSPTEVNNGRGYGTVLSCILVVILVFIFVYFMRKMIL
jgi:hypothetical protein